MRPRTRASRWLPAAGRRGRGSETERGSGRPPGGGSDANGSAGRGGTTSALVSPRFLCIYRFPPSAPPPPPFRSITSTLAVCNSDAVFPVLSPRSALLCYPTVTRIRPLPRRNCNLGEILGFTSLPFRNFSICTQLNLLFIFVTVFRWF